LGGLIVLLLAASNGLGEALVEAGLAADIAVWLAPLTIGVIVFIGGFLMTWGAVRALKETKIAPEKTLESLDDNRRWVKEKVREL
jgi:hypothetical protein